MLGDTEIYQKGGDLFSSIDEDFDPYEKYHNTQELTLNEILELEKKSLGYYLSGHPVLAINNKILKIRTKKISELTSETKTASLVCLVNSVRPIKDKRGRPLTFVNFNDGSGVMDGIVSSEALENCHEILKEGEILLFKGLIEVDDYRTNDLGSLMFRMRVKQVSKINSELIKKVSEVTIDVNNSKATSVDKFSEYIDSFDNEFWMHGSCKLNIRVKSDKSEAIMDIGDKYIFTPSLENLFLLEDIFGKDVLEIK